MHFLSLSTLALAGFLTTPLLAAPTHENALVERAGPSDAPAALAMVQQLYADVKQHTAMISTSAGRFDWQQQLITDNVSLFLDSTVAGLNKRDNIPDAKKTLKASIASINGLVVKTTSDIKKLRGKRDLESPATLAERQLPPPPAPADVAAALAGALMMLMAEIGGALNMIMAALGMAATMPLLGPLTTSLNMLMMALMPVASNLMTLLGGLVDGLLGGLSGALGGLPL
ncbi:MAG: hypothetical protein Q9174_004050 [Haloplaca sp. 1 TL-2023]